MPVQEPEQAHHPPLLVGRVLRREQVATVEMRFPQSVGDAEEAGPGLLPDGERVGRAVRAILMLFIILGLRADGAGFDVARGLPVAMLGEFGRDERA